jgi:hypothetical protein
VVIWSVSQIVRGVGYILFRGVSSCPVLSSLVLPCPVVSCLVSSCLLLSCHFLYRRILRRPTPYKPQLPFTCAADCLDARGWFCLVVSCITSSCGVCASRPGLSSASILRVVCLVLCWLILSCLALPCRLRSFFWLGYLMAGPPFVVIWSLSQPVQWVGYILFRGVSSCLVLSYIVLSCPVVSCIVSSCLLLSCHFLYRRILRRPIPRKPQLPFTCAADGLDARGWFCLIVSCITLSCGVCASRPGLRSSSILRVVCLVLYWLILSCLAMSCLMLPWFAVSYFGSSLGGGITYVPPFARVVLPSDRGVASLAVSRLVLNCLVVSCVVSSCPYLSQLGASYHALYHTILSFVVYVHRIGLMAQCIFCLVVCHIVLSRRVLWFLCCLYLSCLVSSRLVLSCLVLSCLWPRLLSPAPSTSLEPCAF